MKKYLIIGAVLVTLAILFFHRHGDEENAPSGLSAPATTPAVADSKGVPQPSAESSVLRADQVKAAEQKMDDDQKQRLLGPEGIRAFNERENVPLAFYGLVVDQDSNALENVQVELGVTEQYVRPFLTGVTGQTTRLQRQTGADGRFEVSGLKGHSVTVNSLSKEGYEPEFMRRDYGTYLAQGTAPDNPAVFKMWSTNLHEQLIAGDKSFVLIPDGRRYAIDLIKGTIAEGDQGDLVAWIKRPEPVTWGQRYDWSCEVMTPDGGLLESQTPAMFSAPEAGYTNLFAYHEQATVNGWGGATGDRRFYVRLRNGQMYGRMVACLYADYHGTKPAMIQLQYAINPSGSRLLR